eukprot:gene10378-8319_t
MRHKGDIDNLLEGISRNLLQVNRRRKRKSPPPLKSPPPPATPALPPPPPPPPPTAPPPQFPGFPEAPPVTSGPCQVCAYLQKSSAPITLRDCNLLARELSQTYFTRPDMDPSSANVSFRCSYLGETTATACATFYTPQGAQLFQGNMQYLGAEAGPSTPPRAVAAVPGEHAVPWISCEWQKVAEGGGWGRGLEK